MMGISSVSACEKLAAINEKEKFCKSIINLTGGMINWSKSIKENQ